MIGFMNEMGDESVIVEYWIDVCDMVGGWRSHYYGGGARGDGGW